jgi:hypothetical protein
MKKVWREPTLDEILNDPTLDTLLARDGISKDELSRIIDDARETLARVPRSWQEGQEISPVPSRPRSPAQLPNAVMTALSPISAGR